MGFGFRIWGFMGLGFGGSGVYVCGVWGFRIWGFVRLGFGV